MIEQLDRAVLGLQAAAVGRKLYGVDHAVPRRHTDLTAEILSGVLASQPEVRLVRLETKMHFEDEALPSCVHLEDELIPRLAMHGIEWIEFRAGVGAAELVAFLAQLERPVTVAGGVEIGTEHVRVGRLGHAERGGGGERDGMPLGTGVEPDDPVGELKRIWDALPKGERPDHRLAELVENIRLAAAVSTDVCKLLAEVKSHDEYTFVHTVNVAILSASLGEATGLTTQQVSDLTLAALLHDIGKQRTPLAILNKPGKLDETERLRVEQHTVDGAAILLGCHGVPDVAPIVAFEHHANIDGSGYPKLGRRPHLASQIVHVADVFDALRTNRPYRAAMDEAKVRKILSEEASRSFEPALVEVFLERVIRRAGTERSAA